MGIKMGNFLHGMQMGTQMGYFPSFRWDGNPDGISDVACSRWIGNPDGISEVVFFR